MSYDDPYGEAGDPRAVPPHRAATTRAAGNSPPARTGGRRFQGGNQAQARTRSDGPGNDYVEVKDRILEFFAKYPEGSIQTQVVEWAADVSVEIQTKRGESGTYEKRKPWARGVVVVKAWAYRTPDDQRPSTGHSMLLMPGTTPYTEGSELENAETSAVGRALAMIGISVHRGISSGNEIRMKRDDGDSGPVPTAREPRGRPPKPETPTDATPTAEAAPEPSRAVPEDTAGSQRGGVTVDDNGEVVGLDPHAFMSRLRDAFVPQAVAAATAKRMFPDAKSLRDLDDGQRAMLWAIVDLEATAASVPAEQHVNDGE